MTSRLEPAQPELEVHPIKLSRNRVFLFVAFDI
jgi:hypothetical protein